MYKFNFSKEVREIVKKDRLTAEDRLKLIVELNRRILENLHQNKKNLTGSILHPFLVGPSGVGKTTTVIDIFGEENVNTVDMNTSLKEDVLGSPSAILDEEGFSRYLRPDWAKHPVVFFDEFEKAGMNKQTGLLSFMTSFKIRDYFHPDKIIVLGGQPEVLTEMIETSRSAPHSKESAIIEALFTRIIFIPYTFREAVEMDIKNGFIKPGIPDDIIEYKDGWLKKFNLGVKDHIVFNRRFISMMRRYYSELRRIDKRNAERIMHELFWYVDKDVRQNLLEMIVPDDLLIEREKNKDEELLAKKGLAYLDHYQILALLPQQHHEMTAREFFKAFTKAYYFSTKDERLIFFPSLFESVKSKGGVLTTDTTKEFAKYYIYSFIILYELGLGEEVDPKVISLAKDTIQEFGRNEEFETFRNEVLEVINLQRGQSEDEGLGKDNSNPVNSKNTKNTNNNNKNNANNIKKGVMKNMGPSI